VRLRDLDGQFLTYDTCAGCTYHAKAGVHHRYVATLAEADGVQFLCPKCFATNRGPVGTHSVCCWFVGKVPDDAFPKPGRWIPNGAGLDDLTFSGAQGKGASVNLDMGDGKGCLWHGHVKNGEAA
jgi:hypothetical protein